MKLYLIRHGESMGNRLGRIQGWQDFPLSPTGKKQAEIVARFLADESFDAIYSSDLTRAYETALAINEYQNKSVTRWELLKEIGLGPLEGKTKEEIYKLYPEVKERSLLTSGVDGTETVETISSRCETVIEKLYTSHQNEKVALVSHGGFISIFMMYLMLQKDWAKHHRPFLFDNTGITYIEWKEKNKPMVHFTNQTTHLFDQEEAMVKMDKIF